ncbi:DUF2637 domain-containing protein [Actinacidiphila sp. ITFR-21]|uniref:DUF2637 domain-containing protein n=1 Tax=Actinacidiphila sp. ITFR-21 TaxID=3075199 RepID=UPI00288A560B|nr:DUF2637 domain-containing protein [Streptomyces sp. ITFR-21]WNI16317.1 DUF2637 domain-containing protein [Streptomyces sp. ITFR-21]
MPTSTPSQPERPAPIPDRTHPRSLPFDRLVILLLGACGCILSFDSLRQVALATHVRPDLSYLFPIVIDGFIAYGVRAILLLRDAPRSARLYAWTLFGAATAASLWANSLHSVRLNSPGTHVLVLGNHTVAVLSTIAPMALGGATHLHILVTRHGRTQQPESATAGTPSVAPPVPDGIPAAERTTSRPAVPPAAPVAETFGRKAPTSRTGPSRSGARTSTGRPGRRADASIDELAAVIAHAHPDSGQVSRAAAREAIQAAGLSAGNDRIAQALAQLAQDQPASPQLPTG